MRGDVVALELAIRPLGSWVLIPPFRGRSLGFPGFVIFRDNNPPLTPLLCELFFPMPSWLESSWFEYPLSRPITLRHFNTTVLVLGTVYIVFITLVNVIAQGYEDETFLSSDFNNTAPLWYHHLPFVSLGITSTTRCSPFTLVVNGGMITGRS